jgi:DNA segregation ATPase FtsK/SpoIIIE, S-DNA-T family
VTVVARINNQLKDELKYEIVGIGLVGLAVLFLVSILTTKAGIVGILTLRFLKSITGEGRYFIPVLVGALGLVYMWHRKKIRFTFRYYGYLVLYLVVLTLLHMSFPEVNSLRAGYDGFGGGVIGGVLAYILQKAFGIIGTYIILASVSLITIIVITNISLNNVTKELALKTKDIVKSSKSELQDLIFKKDNENKRGTKAICSYQQEKIEPPVIIDNNAVSYEKDSLTFEEQEHTGFDLSHGLEESHLTNAKGAKLLKEDYKKDEDPALTLPLNIPNGDPLIHFRNQDEIIIDAYKLPPVNMLARNLVKGNKLNKDITENIKKLEQTLENFGVKTRVSQVSRGPAITRYEVQPAPGVKVSRIVGLSDDIALSMATSGVRIEAPIPGKAAVGIEVPNKEVLPVSFRDLVETQEFNKGSSKLTVALGKDIGGTPMLADLSKMPHLLIAGSTGSGKSVCMNSLIASILFKARPDEVKFLMVDPKMVELTTYNGIPHLIAPVVTDAKKAAAALRWVVNEMENRYSLFAAAGVKDLTRFNAMLVSRSLGEEKPLPLIVVLIDELADLMMVAPADVEDAICRLAQMARAAGIHLVVATQRPSVDVITGLIKANIPSRISFAVSSQTDSRTILDMGGAEKLLGKGDMLFFPVGAPKPVRVQGVYVSDKEIEDIVEYCKKQAKPEYQEGVTLVAKKAEDKNMDEDELLPEAVRIFIESGQASISMLQRRLRIGYTRAARLMDIMESKGIVGGYEGSKARAILMTLDQYEQTFGED